MMEDEVLHKCDTCGEEFWLPEDFYEECPVCGQDTLEEI